MVLPVSWYFPYEVRICDIRQGNAGKIQNTLKNVAVSPVPHHRESQANMFNSRAQDDTYPEVAAPPTLATP